MFRILPVSIAAFLMVLLGLTFATTARGARIEDLYRQHCAVCHGAEGQGGLGSSLVDGKWTRGGAAENLAAVIRDGLPDMGMQAFGDLLSEKEIAAMVVYLRELEVKANRPRPPPSTDGVFRTQRQRFRVETLLENPRKMWGVSFLPDGRKLVTEIDGAVRLIDRENRLQPPLEGTPEVVRRGQGGMLDVAVHPEYSRNGWIYLAFNQGSGQEGTTSVVRGRIQDHQWGEEQVIYRADPRFRSGAGVHFGTRIVFHGGDVYFSIGDRGQPNLAQHPAFPNGSIFRLREDGRVPEDNPFREEGLPEIWSIGHRNPQALAFRPGTGELWSTEHGPRGGDELNRIRRGLNYGWPKVTHGMNYNGTPITEHTSLPGLEPPVWVWTPSIAVCGMAFADGNLYPGWEGDLMVGGLRAQVLERLRLQDDEVVEREVILKDQGRVRDVKTGPDGLLYLILEGDGSRLVRLVPEA